jgi:hypothetical protein
MIEKLYNKETLGILYITILTIVALVWGFHLIPSPKSEQAFVYDHKRIIDLGEINDTINDYYQNNGNLPQTLDQLNYNIDDSTTSLNKIDPQTQTPYNYTIVDQSDYKLCATFSTNSANDQANAYDDANGDYSNFIGQFEHPAGYYCFNENVSGNSVSVSPSPTCLGNCQTSPTPIVVPFRPPCGPPVDFGTAHIACPMLRVNPSPAIYNGNADGSQGNSPAQGSSGGVN